MPGKILIADGSITSRILLKAKLTAAYYQVTFVDTADELLAHVQFQSPDLLIVAEHLFQEEFSKRLRKLVTYQNQPVLVLQSNYNKKQRLVAFRNGADDVISHPVDEPVLLARLRNHMRGHIAELDLRDSIQTTDGFGFSEMSSQFALPLKVALFTPHTNALSSLDNKLEDLGCYTISRYHPDCLTSLADAPPQADIYLFSIAASDTPEADLLRLARLSSEPSTRSCRILAYLHKPNPAVTSSLLDLGANDVLDADASLEELAHRLHSQAQDKHRIDEMRAMLRKRLDAAMTDPLTGLYNRRYAVPFLQQQIERARLSGQQFTVMLADLDHFKCINDQHGHAAGDQVLTHVADKLRGALDAHDMIARIGGEEFLIVLPTATQDKARNIANSLRRLVREMPIRLSDEMSPIHITISIGVTFAPHEDNKTNPCTADALLKHADKALYRAKSLGRNTVTLDMRSAA
ncbi:Response regulator PleD [Roseovarius albus]|uniref:diguanylate cyclase n=1 Tax=Roseovarius albus TaxID=1247867 RepID=A0A1X6YIH9_9RHOB|nr:diguanylate cyclase [Roseovarius albus]SLN22357.1 Response regulator PleD [Roseovarius albus]